MADVLVVDDDETICRTLARLLRASGLPSHCLPSGEDVLRYLADDASPKLVLLDVMMPGIGGLAVLKAIRDEPRLSALSVVMYSAISDASVQDEARRLGAHGYIIKGRLEWPQLYEQIQQYLQ
jgi:PleD family two-component response regulator